MPPRHPRLVPPLPVLAPMHGDGEDLPPLFGEVGAGAFDVVMAAIYAYAAMRSKDAEWRFFWEISVVGSLGLAWQKYQQQRTHHP